MIMVTPRVTELSVPSHRVDACETDAAYAAEPMRAPHKVRRMRSPGDDQGNYSGPRGRHPHAERKR